MPDASATLYIFSGLPGTGKSMLARSLVTSRRAVYLRIDTIEEAIRDLCHIKVQGEGYRLAYRIAADNLAAGLNVVADSCNPIQLTRDEWEQTAARAGANCVNIEIICSDLNEHRRRVESRTSDIPGLRLPTWNEVINREYHPWIKPRIVIDTARKSEAEAAGELGSKLP